MGGPMIYEAYVQMGGLSGRMPGVRKAELLRRHRAGLSDEAIDPMTGRRFEELRPGPVSPRAPRAQVASPMTIALPESRPTTGMSGGSSATRRRWPAATPGWGAVWKPPAGPPTAL